REHLPPGGGTLVLRRPIAGSAAATALPPQPAWSAQPTWPERDRSLGYVGAWRFSDRNRNRRLAGEFPGRLTRQGIRLALKWFTSRQTPSFDCGRDWLVILAEHGDGLNCLLGAIYAVPV